MSTAKIIRAPRDKEHRWKTVNVTAAEDPRLSWEARGLAFYLLAKPNDWEIYPSDLVKKGIAGKDMVYRMLKELELAGYLERQRVRDEAGKIVGMQSLFHEQPLHMNAFDRPERKRTAPQADQPDADCPDMEKPDLENPDLENPHTTKKELPPHINQNQVLTTTTPTPPQTTTPQPAQAPVGGGGSSGKKTTRPAPEAPNMTDTFLFLRDTVGLGDLGTLNRCAGLPLAAVAAEWERVKAQGKGAGWLVKVITAPTWRADVPPPPTARDLAHQRQLEYAAEELRRNLARLEERKNAPYGQVAA